MDNPLPSWGIISHHHEQQTARLIEQSQQSLLVDHVATCQVSDLSKLCPDHPVTIWEESRNLNNKSLNLFIRNIISCNLNFVTENWTCFFVFDASDKFSFFLSKICFLSLVQGARFYKENVRNCFWSNKKLGLIKDSEVWQDNSIIWWFTKYKAIKSWNVIFAD